MFVLMQLVSLVKMQQNGHLEMRLRRAMNRVCDFITINCAALVYIQQDLVMIECILCIVLSTVNGSAQLFNFYQLTSSQFPNSVALPGFSSPYKLQVSRCVVM